MTTRTSRWTTDLLVTLLGTALATGAVLFDLGPSPLRTALVVPLVVFLPGYALVAALVPARDGDPGMADTRAVTPPGVVGAGLAPAARVGLSVAASIALLPAVVLALSGVLGGIHAVESGLVLAVLTTLLTLVALVRRWRLPPEDRMAVPAVTGLPGRAARPFRVQSRGLSDPDTFTPTSRRGLLLNVALAGSVLLFLGTVAGAYAYPTEGDGFTELYLVTKSPDGEFVAADYPHDVAVGESGPVYASVANHEGEPQTYTLVVLAQEVEGRGDAAHVTKQRELSRTSRPVADGDTERIRHDLQPPFAGDRIRVQFLLYVGDAPADPSTETAYRSVHLWLSTDRSGGA